MQKKLSLKEFPYFSHLIIGLILTQDLRVCNCNNWSKPSWCKWKCIRRV